MEARQRTTAKPSSALVPSQASTGLALLQRKCACGGASGMTGSCPECEKNKLLGKPLQTKLAISEPGDTYEQEADRVAEQVMRMPATEVSRQSPHGGRPLVQRRATSGGTSVLEAPPIVHDVLNSPGQPLDAETRAFFEPRFGYDFGHVRVHTGVEAGKSACSLSALAYTAGNHVVLRDGPVGSSSREGKQLIAHELAHVVQQSNAMSFRHTPQEAPVRIPSSPSWLVQRQEATSDEDKPIDESLGFTESLVIKGVTAGATVGMPLLEPVVKGGVTGLYTEVRHQLKEGKGQRFMERLKGLATSPADMLAYGKGYVWGLLQGLWSPVQGIVDIVKLAWQLQQWQLQVIGNVIQNFHEIVAMQGSLIERLTKLGQKAKGVIEGIKGNVGDFVGRVVNALSGGVFELAKRGGRKAGQAIFKFLEKPWGEIGESIGMVIGTVLVEVLMAVFSAGIGNALTKVGQALDKVAPTLMKGVRFIASELGTIIKEIHAVAETIKAGLAKAGRSLLKGFEEFLGEAGGLFDELVVFLKKIFSGAEEAAAKVPINAPSKVPTPHVPAAHKPPIREAPRIEAGPGKTQVAEPRVPKEPSLEPGGKQPEVAVPKPKEPTGPKSQANAVNFVEQNPHVINGEPGQRHASVGGGHEIVEVPDPDFPSGIGCELHSPPPYRRVPCPSGMGNTSGRKGGTPVKPALGKAPFDEPLSPAERKLTPEQLKQKHILEDQASRQNEFRSGSKQEATTGQGRSEVRTPGRSVPKQLERGQLAHEYAELLIKESELPRGLRAEVHAELPGGRVRLDRVDFEQGVYYEIKPNTMISRTAGKNQIRIYEEYMNRNFPLPDGKRWTGRVVTYEHADAIGMFGF